MPKATGAIGAIGAIPITKSARPNFGRSLNGFIFSTMYDVKKKQQHFNPFNV
jgi:hypothetical protein